MSTSSSSINNTAANQMPRQPGSSPGPAYGQTPAQKELLHFLATAPRLWTSPTDPPVRKYKMASGEEISCVFWKGRFFITGTDIVKILIFHFQQMGRGILNPKKFEEGVFSDLRNLKPGVDAVLEEPRSEFLEFLHKHGCIRTQKKQKVFFWHRVPHEDLLREAMERNLRRVSSVFQWTQMMNSPEMMSKCMGMLAPGMPMMPGPMMIPNQIAPYMYTAAPVTAIHPGLLTAGNAAPTSPSVEAAPSSLMLSQPARMAQASSQTLHPHPHPQPQTQIAAPLEYHPHPQRTHPRRTISLSAVDFTPRPAIEERMPMSPMLGSAKGMANIASALSSPLFSPATTAVSETDFEEGYFDLTPALSQPPVFLPGEAEHSQLEPLATQIINESTSSLGAEERLIEDPSAVPPADHALQEELDSLTTPPSEMLMDSTLNMGGDCFLGDVWAADKLGAAEPPLWDDLAMMIPNVAPNHREPA